MCFRNNFCKKKHPIDWKNGTFSLLELTLLHNRAMQMDRYRTDSNSFDFIKFICNVYEVVIGTIKVQIIK